MKCGSHGRETSGRSASSSRSTAPLECSLHQTITIARRDRG